MKQKRWLIGALGALCMAAFGGIGAQAAFDPDVENAYNMAVQGQDALDGLDVSVSETTVSSATNLSAAKKVRLKVSGIKSNFLKSSIEVLTDESSSTSYYLDGYYYTSTTDGSQKQAMEREDIWTLINSEIYLDMTSNYLKMLYSKEDGNGTTYYFAATSETLGDYAKKLLTGIGVSEGITIDSLQGTMDTDADGHVLQRSLQIVYTVAQGESTETFFTQSLAQFHQDEDGVTIDLPDLSEYKEAKPEEPVVTITPLVRTVYVTTDVNVRAAGNLSAVILGGLYAGSGVTQIGYTSDGWIQIQYNEAPGYVWGDYVSEEKPVLTKNSSGTMYATASVNVRADHSSDSEILGALKKGQAVEITGTTDNGWVRVKFNGATAYVFADYLSWSEPVTDTYVKNGYVYGESGGSVPLEGFTVTGKTGSVAETYAKENGFAFVPLDVVLLGDVTGDGAITSADALQIQRYVVKRDSVLKNASKAVLDAADVTQDGQVTSADALQIQRHVVKRPSVLD